MTSDSLPTDPFRLFDEWMREAEDGEPHDANAMALATTGPSGPSVRMVLLKDVSEGGFVFYTNAESRKGEELKAGSEAALLFYWKSLRRQVRIEGPVTRVSEAESDAYFDSRPRASQIGAWASLQSRPLTERQELEQAHKALGIEPNSSDREVKTAYRRLMNQHHPDKLVAKGLPDSMLEMAKERTREIRAAYDMIKKNRNIR